MRKSSLLSVLVVLLLGCASEDHTRDLTLATDTAPTFQQCRPYVLQAQRYTLAYRDSLESALAARDTWRELAMRLQERLIEASSE